jgi:hypothetical protein
MKVRAIAVNTLLVAASLTSTAHARFSGDPFAGYCIIQKVVVGQDDGARPAVQIWGTCTMINHGGMYPQGEYVPTTYADPRRGYLYYFTPKAKEEVARKEWADLTALAGTSEVVAIGSDRLPSRLRWTDEKPQSPDEYATQTGLVKITTNPAYAKIVAALKNVAEGK